MRLNFRQEGQRGKVKGRPFPGHRFLIRLAVVLLAFLCSACSGSSRSPEEAKPVFADLILSGGKIWTGATEEDPAEAIGLQGNTILAAGSSESVMQWAGPETVLLDLAGRVVIPGFHDAHIHLYHGSLSSLGPDLLTAPTLPLVLSRVSDYARSHPEVEWILGHGWYFDILPGGSLPSKHDLDRVLPDRPVLLIQMSGHYGWVNSEALRRAGVDRETPDPPGGTIGRDPLTGEPDGLLFETATGLVYGFALASMSAETKRQVLLERMGELNRLGVTSVDEIHLMPGVDEVDLSSYLALEQEGMLTCRVNVFLSGDLDREEILGWKERLKGSGLRLGGLKVFVDGNFQAHTAWLLSPYADRPDSRGQAIYSQQELDEIAVQAQCMGLPVKFHAIGDAAVRSALDAIEAARSACPPMEACHSVEHVELLDPRDLDRFASLSTVASVQPLTALFSTIPLLSMVIPAVGPERSGHLFPNRSLKEAGATVAFGTDWPAGPFLNPLITLWTSRARTGVTDPVFGLPEALQAFSLEEALSAYSAFPARALGMGDVLGTLEKGKLADLAVLSRDVFSLPDSALLTDVEVDLTVMDGKIVFLRQGMWPEMAPRDF